MNTCHNLVKVEGLPSAADTLDRNEESTLFKMGLQQQNIRLACQILVDENLKNVTVEVIGCELVE